MKYAIIEDGLVKNLAVSNKPLEDNWIIDLNNEAQIGGTWDGIKFYPKSISNSILSENIRIERNNLLSLSDWTQLADAPVDKVKWSEYRQALRDITLQTEFPNKIIWPDKP